MVVDGYLTVVWCVVGRGWVVVIWCEVVGR